MTQTGKKKNNNPGLEIAVIGIAGRFPGARNVYEFWENLKKGVESVGFFSDEELKEAGVDQVWWEAPNYVRTNGASLEDRECFDGSFFGYTPRECETMDPQMRIFHECVWEALEDAGYIPDEYDGLIGLYGGGSFNFNWVALAAFSGKGREMGIFSLEQLVNKDFLCMRVSYKLDLKGPAVLIQTACSTSLAAVHIACRALLTGECDMAVAGGIKIPMNTRAGYFYQEGMILSVDGHCRAFDAAARGVVSGDGVGLAVLKRYKHAIEDNDHIRAVVLGSAINNDGTRKVGFTAPSPGAQAEVIETVLRLSGVEPESIGYIECHGTGTALGDPVEIEALKKALACNKTGFCALGSVKTNIGHLDTAAGIAGFIKTVLALSARLIPPSLHFERPNPAIDFENSPFYVNNRLREWQNDTYPLRAGVSSFGIGGTNAHVLLEEAVPPEPSPPARPYQLLLFSAREEYLAHRSVKNFARYLRKHPGIPLADAAYTLKVGRKSFQYKQILVCSDKPGTTAALSIPGSKPLKTFYYPDGVLLVVFLFSGLGAEYVNMGRQLYRDEAAFREAADSCFKILEGRIDFDIKKALYPDEPTAGERFSLLRFHRFDAAQLAVFILEYSLARLLLKWGIVPDAMMGYSFGEYTAACISGVFSLETVLKVLAARASLIKTLPAGAMLSVPLTCEELNLRLNPELSLAIDNGDSCIVSGPVRAIENLETQMKERKILCLRVPAYYALHSRMMEPISKKYEDAVARFPLYKPQIPYISNVTGDFITAEAAISPAYWARHLRETVQFHRGMKRLAQKENAIFIEIGPGRDLCSVLTRYTENNRSRWAVNLIRPAEKNIPDVYYLLERIGRLWGLGVKINWHEFHHEEKRYRVPLPTYPFERQRYAPGDTFAPGIEEMMAGNFSPEMKRGANDWYYVPSWERSLVPTPEVEPREQVKGTCWLVFIDEYGVANQWLNAAEEEQWDIDIIRVAKTQKSVAPGPRAAGGGPRIYLVDPGKDEDYDALFKELRDINRVPDKIVHFWGVSRDIPVSEWEEGGHGVLETGLFSLLGIVQALGRHRVTASMELIAITSNMQEVTGKELSSPLKASILGPVKVIPLEYPNISCRSIDIDGREPWGDDMSRRLWQELLVKAPGPVVAYRGNFRWVQTMKPHPLHPARKLLPPLKEKGVYLVTGGFGGMGFTLAGFLAESLKARLIMVARSPFPDRDRWPQWLETHDPRDPVSQKIRKMQDWEKLGAAFMIHRVDVSDYEGMRRVKARAEKQWGQINGVLHTAGIIDYDGVIQRRTRQMTENSIAAKIKGTLVLHRLLNHGDQPLDLFILFSSIGNYLYGIKFGQVGYNAGNEFLDAFALYNRHPRDTLVLSINWTDWREVGMAVTAHERAGGEAKDLESPQADTLSPRQGVDVFKRILASGLSRAAVCTMDLPLLMREMNESKNSKTFLLHRSKETPPPGSSYKRPGLHTAYKAPRSHIEEKLSRIFQHFFGIEQVGIEDDFFELGGDSLKAINLVSRISRELEVQVPLAEFFSRPVIKALAEYIKESETRNFLSITPAEEKEYYPLSPAQKRLYFLHEMGAQSTHLNQPRVFILEGEHPLARLEKAVMALIRRHESLRTSFTLIKNELVQKIHKTVPFKVEYDEADEQEADPKINSFVRPFDLACPPLVRMEIVKIGKEKYIFMWDMHHIISDGTSNGLFKEEFSLFYQGKEPSGLKLNYRDYVEWLEGKKKSTTPYPQESFWRRQFAGEIPVMDLPVDFKSPVIQRFEGSTICFTMDKQDTRRLKKYASTCGVTLFVLMLAVYNVFLSKISGKEDIVIGTTAAGRGHADLERIIGMFLNTLALRNYPRGDKSFGEFLNEVKERTLSAFENQDYPFENLVETLEVKREASRAPLFSVMLIFQNISDQREALPVPGAGLKWRNYEYKRKTSVNDITLYVEEINETLIFSWEYSEKLFRPGTIKRFISYFNKIVGMLLDFTGSGERKIAGMEIIHAEEKQRILFEFNNTAKAVVRDKCYQQLWEESLIGYPDRIAAIHGSKQTTYKQLDEEAGYIAHRAAEYGQEPGSVIALYMSRGIHVLASIIGIFKAGCAYLPLDMEYPEERIKTILQDCKVKLMIGEIREEEKVRRAVERVSNLETLLYSNKRRGSQGNPAGTLGISSPPTPDSLAYVIYTSGTTGKPKGVMIRQIGMLNHLYAKINDLALNQDDIIAQTAPAGFDISVWQFLDVLLLGGRTLIIEKETVIAPMKFLRVLREGRITILETVPSLAAAFLEVAKNEKDAELPHMRWMIMTGEALGVHLVRDWYDKYPGIKILNAYGPTEASDDVTHYVIDEKPRKNQWTIPIGKPVQNMHIYIMDKNLRLCPIGVKGEICAAGIGVGKGYWQDPGKTGNRFVPNPYCEEIGNSDYNIIYRTGDIGYFKEDGNIECLGRMDHQVKIRGFRIELGEIESQLLTYEGIKKAVVAAKIDKRGDKFLCAYIVSRKEYSALELREFLSGKLPDYMIPLHFVPLEKIPLTPNGKIDRKSLPEPWMKASKDYEAPLNNEEMRLVELWSEVLGIEKKVIGLNHNFFHLGGHSLKATVLTAKIHKELNVMLPLAEVFKAPTVRALAQYIRKTAKDRYESIQPVEKKEYYPLSSAQKRLYVLQQMELANIAYNIPQTLALEGKLKDEILERTFLQLIKRHESLRTSFHMMANEPVQRIHNDVEFGIEYYDLQMTGEGDRCGWEETSRGQIPNHKLQITNKKEAGTHHSLFVRPFDLSQAPLLRVGLIKEAEKKYILMMDMHHIITDGVSMDLFVRETMALYSRKELTPLQFQYKDYAQWQNSIRKKETIKEQEEYWMSQFAGEVPVLNLPLDYSRPALQNFEGDVLAFELFAESTGALNQLALDTSATLYMVLLALYSVLLAKLSGQEDIVVGTPIAGRRHPDLQRIIGMCVNTLPIRNYPNGDKTFEDFLQEVKRHSLEAFENQEYQFEDLVEHVSVNRDTSRNPLFDTMFSLQNVQVQSNEIPIVDISQLRIRPYKTQYRASKFDLTLNCNEAEGKLLCSFEYCTKLFKKETIARFIIYFQQILSTVLKDSNEKISQIEIITAEEKRRILYDFNDTAATYPEDKTLQRLFAEQVKQTPENIAVVGEMQGAERKAQGIERDKERHALCAMRCALTYRELNEKSNQLSLLLINKGVRPDTIVGIMVERSLEMIIGILGILKAGGAYLPIDPDYPQERIDYMLKNSGAKIFLTGQEIAALYSPQAFNNRPKGTPSHLHLSPAPVTSLAYIIYTSGTTGKPKGILVEHYSVVNLVSSQKKIFGIHEQERILQFSPLCFDASVEQIFIALTSGAALILIEKEVILDREGFERFISTQLVSHIHAVPSFLNNIPIKPYSGLKRVISGGDICPVSLAQKWSQFCDFYNEYGPTETTVTSIEMPVKQADQTLAILPIGKPIDNTIVFLVDKGMQTVPPGLAGALYIGGDGLARGYLNQPELTAERFVSSPFTLHPSRLYKTGDLALWLPDGNIDFLGRMDHQVKIRGFRIELGEIESQLLTYEEIKETVVVAKTDEKGDKTLCAYIVSNKEHAALELRKFLSGKLPGFMIPSYFVPLEKIPLTPNGKVDRKSLPKPGIEMGQSYIAPGNKIEKKLAAIWSELLSLDQEKISIDANFFQMGGHSLKVAVMTARVHKELHVKLSMAEIFKNPNIKSLSRYIKDREKEEYRAIEPIEKKEYYFLSPAQKRLYMQQQMDLHSTAYNMPQFIFLSREIQEETLREILKHMINRHESFRTSFHMKDEEPVQKVHDEVDFEVEYYRENDVEVKAKDEEEQSSILEGTRGLAPLSEESHPSSSDVIRHRNMSSDFVRPFDLSCAPLLRVGLIKLPHTPAALPAHPSQEGIEDKYLLMVDMHHIISDGISHEILKTEFKQMYNGQELPGLRLQYKDFSQWRNHQANSLYMKIQEAYWLKQFTGSIPTLNLPTDYPRFEVKDFKGSRVNFEISSEAAAQIRKISTDEGNTSFITIFAVFNVFLAKLSGQVDIIVGIPVAGRNHADLQSIIGMFVNTLAIRNYPRQEKTFLQFLREVKTRVLEAFENQGYPLEELVEKAVTKRESGRSPLFDVMFQLRTLDPGYDGEPEQEISAGKPIVSEDEPDELININRTSKYDLTFDGMEVGKKLSFSVEYSARLFKKETIEHYVDYFQQILLEVLKKPDIPLKEIRLSHEYPGKPLDNPEINFEF